MEQVKNFNSNPFLNVAIEETTFDSISDGKSQLRTDEVMSMYPNGVTVTHFDIIKTEDKEFSIILFKENQNAFFYGGTVLTKLCKAWCESVGLPPAETSEQLNACGGVKIKLSRAVGKNKLTYVKVDVIR